MTKNITRRSFNKAGAVAAGITILANSKSARGTPANEKLILGLIGCGGRGPYLAQGFLERRDCEFAYMADVDASKLSSRVGPIAEAQAGKAPQQVQDFRKMLDDQSLDAVVVATPDHWHALASIWACQAGKDVYVEKPITHSCWEGRKMVEAARKYGRIVQGGFQNRSAPYNMEAKQYILDGKLGDVHLCRIYNQKPPWGNCPVVEDSNVPAGLDWDMWNGPAPEHAYNSSMHSCWHHQWRYSGGDIANDASHQIDLARWLLGVDYPKSVYSTGGRFDVQSAAESPDTQIALYDYDKLLVSFELTLFAPYILKTDSVVRDNDMFPYWLQNSTRIEIFGTEGMMIIGRHGGGWQVFVRPQNRQPVVKDQMYGRFPDPEHKENFFSCIRSRELPNADVLESHLSCAMIHYANCSYRLGGQKLTIDPTSEFFTNSDEGNSLLRREYREPWVIRDEV
ncbi:MAG: Gfo/Idh/MocA family oxidoreductase [Planctomycetales bacterium]|nr:Gfo/Idh/MocA family oxidoreductase [Planctomycetales bacterium]